MNARKNSLFISVLSLILCCCMFVGTTFAWFTDEIQSSINTITAGNLDVELEYRVGDKWEPVTDNTLLFDHNALWEPGHTEVAYLRIRNVGSLALQYHFSVNITDEVPGVNQEGNTFHLSNYIYMGVIEDNADIYVDRDAALAAVRNADTIKNAIVSGSMEQDAPAKYVTLVVYMPEATDNVANHNGKDIPSIKLGVNLLATQFTSEADSFGPDYDAGASTVLPSGKPDYAWDFTGATPADQGLTVNGLTLTNGAAGNGTLSNATLSLSQPLTLNHDDPWAVEWTSGQVGNQYMLFTSHGDPYTNESQYIYVQPNAGIYIGYRENNTYHNYGVHWKDIPTQYKTGEHTYRLQNQPVAASAARASAGNRIWLYIDGEKIAPMISYNQGGAVTNTTSDALSGRDFTFAQMGSSINDFRITLNLSSVCVTKDTCKAGHQIVTTPAVAPTCYATGLTAGKGCARCGLVLEAQTVLEKTDHEIQGKRCIHCGLQVMDATYQWSFAGAQPQSMTGGSLLANSLTNTQGSAANGQLTNAIYTLEKSLTLRSSAPWAIEWVCTQSSEEYMLLASGNTPSITGSQYIFFQPNNGLYLGYRQSNYRNIGVYWENIPTQYRTGKHTWRLQNAPDGDGSNQIWLYIDGERIAPMTSYNQDGTIQNTTTNALSGMDFTFTQFGASGNFAITMAMDSVSIDMGVCRDGHQPQTIPAVPATCKSTGLSEGSKCAVCGCILTEQTVVGKTAHQNDETGCTVCGKPLWEQSLAGKKISILGDSISTYGGVSNSTAYRDDMGNNAVFYTNQIARDETYWMRLIDRFDLELCVNNSWSGSYVTTHKPNVNGHLDSDGTISSGIARADKLTNKNGDKPDIILTYIGINDLNAGVSATAAEDAYNQMLAKIKETYPDAQVFCIGMPNRTGSDTLSVAYNTALQNAIAAVGGNIHYVDLFNSALSDSVYQ